MWCPTFNFRLLKRVCYTLFDGQVRLESLLLADATVARKALAMQSKDDFLKKGKSFRIYALDMDLIYLDFMRAGNGWHQAFREALETQGYSLGMSLYARVVSSAMLLKSKEERDNVVTAPHHERVV